MAASILNVNGDNFSNDLSACYINNNHVVNSANISSISNSKVQPTIINNNSGTSTLISQNLIDMKEKRNTLEQRKQHLEKLLLEKKWILQQIQKEEVYILQGNYDDIHFKDIFTHLSQQYKLTQDQENLETDLKINNNNNIAILRRKSSSSIREEDNGLKQLINFKIHLPEVSNRSSEYDNYPCNRSIICENEPKLESILTYAKSNKSSNPIIATSLNKSFDKKHQTTSHFDNCTPPGFASSPKQIQRKTADTHRFSQEYMKHHSSSHQQRQPRQQKTSHAADTISLYSINSSNVATLRQQHIPPQQQPIVVQYEKYFLSPTKQTYNNGNFIKSSQDIKRLIPSPQQRQQSTKSQSSGQILSYQQSQSLVACKSMDTISLAPSHISSDSNVIAIENVNVLGPNDNKSALASNWIKSTTESNVSVTTASNKQLDILSICSTNSENQKRNLKPKVWLESSLDGPLLRATCAQNTNNSKVYEVRTPIFEKKKR